MSGTSAASDGRALQRIRKSMKKLGPIFFVAVAAAMDAFFKYYFDKFQVVNFKHDLLQEFFRPGRVQLSLSLSLSLSQLSLSTLSDTCEKVRLISLEKTQKNLAEEKKFDYCFFRILETRSSEIWKKELDPDFSRSYAEE